MLMTCVAILSIGFRVFPRRGFGKAESFGLSLMEIGTGAGTGTGTGPFIISSSKRDVASPSSGKRSVPRLAFLLLGIGRLVSV